MSHKSAVDDSSHLHPLPRKGNNALRGNKKTVPKKAQRRKTNSAVSDGAGLSFRMASLLEISLAVVSGSGLTYSVAIYVARSSTVSILRSK
mmetsp:Transcript_11552/g.19554  ORF Transcript_11552/g.19554 Transcript_11552/m.19554 type:complete len:91 (+) Transcript_11552:143-415(+)